MINQEVRSKIKRLKIYTRRLMQSSLAGDYSSAFKGSGLEFDQLREYQYGDDVRFIDWNSSAKMNKIMIKQFVEERDRTIILAIDVSASSFYSSQKELRQELIAQIAAALSFVASENKDKVGALFFSDGVEQWIAPARGNVHVGRILEAIFSLRPQSKKTNLAEALRFLVSLKKRNAVVFMISDWIGVADEYTKLLKVASCEYDFVGMRVLDHVEHRMPNVGIIEVIDPETGNVYALNTARANTVNTFLQLRMIEQRRVFEKYKIDLLDLVVGQPFIHQLITFFHQRIRRQI